MLGANLSDQIPGGPNLTLTLTLTIAHEMITELIPKQFRFGSSSTEITEHNAQNISVK